jgi:hypothetical protein
MSLNSALKTHNGRLLTASGYHRPDLNVVCVRYDLILGHELITADDQMRLHDEIQIPQHLAHPLWTFDLNFPVRMTQLDDHKAILRPAE